MPRKEYTCNCAKYCKIEKRVAKSTYYAHAPFRMHASLSTSIEFHLPQGPATQANQVFGQAPPIADILGAYPNLNLGGPAMPHREVRMHRSQNGVELSDKQALAAQKNQDHVQPPFGTDFLPQVCFY